MTISHDYCLRSRGPAPEVQEPPAVKQRKIPSLTIEIHSLTGQIRSFTAQANDPLATTFKKALSALGSTSSYDGLSNYRLLAARKTLLDLDLTQPTGAFFADNAPKIHYTLNLGALPDHLFWLSGLTKQKNIALSKALDAGDLEAIRKHQMDARNLDSSERLSKSLGKLTWNFN